MLFKSRLYKNETEPALEFFDLDKLIVNLNSMTPQNTLIGRAKRFMARRLNVPNCMRELKVEALGCYILRFYPNKNDKGDSRYIGNIEIDKRCDIKWDYRIETLTLSMPFYFPQRDLMNYKIKLSRERVDLNEPSEVKREDQVFYDNLWGSTNVEKYIPTEWFLSH